MEALTDRESKLFNAIVSGEYDNFALVRTEFEGIEAACIAAITNDGDEYAVTPVALLLEGDVFDAVFDRMTDPAEDL